MDGNCKRITEQPSKNSSESLNNSIDEDTLFIENLKDNKDIGPWEAENNKVFDLFCQELEGSKQFIKHSLQSKSRQKRKKKTNLKNEEHPIKYTKDKIQTHQYTTQEDTTLATQILSSVQHSISYRGSKQMQDLNTHHHHHQQNINERKGNEIQKEYNQFQRSNSKLFEQQKPLIIQSMAEHPLQNYHLYSKRKSLNDDNLSVNNNSINSDEKIMMESFKRKSQSLARQPDQLNNTIHQMYNYHISSYSSNGNYQINANNSQLQQANSSQQQLVGYFDQIQANQVESLEKKILQKYFAFYPLQQQQHQQQTISPKNQVQVKNSVQINIKRDSPTPKGQNPNNNEHSPSKNLQNHTQDILFSPNEGTQLQQALKNQSIKFKKIKSLRSKFKPISTHSSQEKINLINIKDLHEKPPLPNAKQKNQTQEDLIPSNQIASNTNKNLPILKGSGYVGIYFDPPQTKQQKDRTRLDTTQQTQPVLLQNQKYHHQNIQQQQNIQKQLQLQSSQPQSARDYTQYDQATSTISRLGDSQSRKNSFHYSRVESRDSYHQINYLKPTNHRIEFDSSRVTPLRNNTFINNTQLESSKISNELRQQYFNNSPWQKKNTSKLPQLILSSILNNGNNNDDQVAAINLANRTNQNSNFDEVIQNPNSSRIVNFPLYDEKPPTYRPNYHLNPQQQTKYIQLYYYRNVKKPGINSPRDFSHSPSQLQKYSNN